MRVKDLVENTKS